MPHLIHQTAFVIHVTIGALALLLFWLPLIASKGSKNHRFYGNLFINGMYAVAISGFLMSTLVIIDPIAVRMPTELSNPDKIERFILQNRIFAGFLLMLSILVWLGRKKFILRPVT